MTFAISRCFCSLRSCSPAPHAPSRRARCRSRMPQVQLTFAPVVKRIAPAVVNVYARSVVQAPMNPVVRRSVVRAVLRRRADAPARAAVAGLRRDRARRRRRSSPTIMSSQGGTDIVVALADKREFKAKVLLADPRTDLAVLKIDTKGETACRPLPFADSDKVQVGDLVLAVGDPFGVGQTVTMGIVSALARTQVSASDYQFFIQTDAAINPGNSGGALVTTDGKLAGINTSIVSRTGESIGIGFAIPANLARRVLEGALGGGVKLAWFGADGQPVTAEIANSLGISVPNGVLLQERLSRRSGGERRTQDRRRHLLRRRPAGERHAVAQLPHRHAQGR